MADQINDFFKKAEQEVNAQTEGNNKEYDEVWSKEAVSIEDAVEEQSSQTENQAEDNPTTIDNENKQEEIVNNGNSITLTKPLKYRGKEIYPKTEDELIELAQKGLDYSFKMNKIAPFREIIDYVSNNNITLDMIKNINSNNENYEEDIPYEEDVKDLFEDEPVTVYDKVLKELGKANKPLANKFVNIYANLDDKFKYELKDEQTLRALIGSINSGEFENFYPKAVEIKKVNPFMTWIESYQNAVNGLKAQRNVENPDNSLQDNSKTSSKRNISQNKSIKEQYDEVWKDEMSINDLEKLLIEGV